MKQKTTLLILLFITLFVYGQRKEPVQDLQIKSFHSSKQKIDSVIIQIWDENTNTWIFFSKQDFIYDTHGNMTKRISEDWKSEYIYNAGNNLTQSLDYKWNENNKQWEMKGIKDYTYDAKGNMILYYESDRKEEYTYDANGNMIEQLEYYQDAPDHWVKQYKHNYSYNMHGDRSQTIGYRWDTDISQWVAIDKLEYSFDAGDYIIKSDYYNWDESTGEWENGWKEEYTLDDKGNIIQNLQSEWSESGVLESFRKFVYTYDNSYVISDLILPIFDDDFSPIEALDMMALFNHKMISFVSSAWDDIKDDWNDIAKGDYYYSEHNITYLNETEPEISRIYPNPAYDIIYITIDNTNNATIEIYNVIGKLLYNKVVDSKTEMIDVSDYTAGIYLIKVKQDDKIYTKNVIVR